MADSKKKVALLSNVTVDLIIGKLRREYDFYLPEGFDTWVQEAINPSAGIYSAEPDAVIVLLDGTEARSWKDGEGDARISLWKQALTALVTKIKSSVPIPFINNTTAGLMPNTNGTRTDAPNIANIC